MTEAALPARPRVLVYVGLDLVGDGLIKLPFVRALRRAFPDGELIWLAGKGQTAYKHGLAPLVEGLLDVVLEEAEVGNRMTELLSRPLPSQYFDLVIDTQRRVLTTLILRRIRCGRFVSGSADFMLSDVKPRRPYQRPPALIAQLLELVELATGRAAEPDAPLKLSGEVRALAAALLPPGAVYVGLVPGAGGKHKCWPLNSFANVGRVLAQEGKVPVFLLGPDEARWADDIAAAAPAAYFPLQHPRAKRLAYAPELTIALAERLAAAVANDSGGGHMVATAGTPLVSLFGPTDPAKFAPLTAQLILLRAQSWGGSDMALIPDVAVLQAIDRLLATRPAGKRA